PSRKPSTRPEPSKPPPTGNAATPEKLGSSPPSLKRSRSPTPDALATEDCPRSAWNTMPWPQPLTSSGLTPGGTARSSTTAVPLICRDWSSPSPPEPEFASGVRYVSKLLVDRVSASVRREGCRLVLEDAARARAMEANCLASHGYLCGAIYLAGYVVE